MHESFKLRRQRRVDWLVENFKELHLGTYPWGLSRTKSEERVTRYHRERAIFRKMQDAGVMAQSTDFHNCNINNLIVDAQKQHRLNKRNASRKD